RRSSDLGERVSSYLFLVKLLLLFGFLEPMLSLPCALGRGVKGLLLESLFSSFKLSVWKGWSFSTGIFLPISFSVLLRFTRSRPSTKEMELPSAPALPVLPIL